MKWATEDNRLASKQCEREASAECDVLIVPKTLYCTAVVKHGNP